MLAGDVLIMSIGSRMVGKLARALNLTHEYLHDMGSKIAPSKSFNFSNTTKARKWLHETWWPHIDSHIDVVNDFRYLGAHLSAGSARTNRTLKQRWAQAIIQLR